jgi:hypothetical protein
MKRYTTVHPLFMSFYSKSLYRDVGANWRKISYLYLLLLLSVCLIPVMFRTHQMVSDYVHAKAPEIVKQIPVITITKGEVSADVNMPYVIRDPESKAPVVVIDTTGQTTTLKDSGAFVLLTKKSLIIRKEKSGTRTFDLSEIESLTINQSVAYEWIETFLDYFIFVLYPLSLIFSLALRIVQALIFALMGLVLSTRLRADLKFSSFMSLAIVAMTPSIMLDTVYNYIDIAIPSWWLVDFIIALGYFFFALRAVAEERSSETRSGPTDV